jgi:hypothetical protein
MPRRLAAASERAVSGGRPAVSGAGSALGRAPWRRIAAGGGAGPAVPFPGSVESTVRASRYEGAGLRAEHDRALLARTPRRHRQVVARGAREAGLERRRSMDRGGAKCSGHRRGRDTRSRAPRSGRDRVVAQAVVSLARVRRCPPGRIGQAVRVGEMRGQPGRPWRSSGRRMPPRSRRGARPAVAASLATTDSFEQGVSE